MSGARLNTVQNCHRSDKICDGVAYFAYLNHALCRTPFEVLSKGAICDRSDLRQTVTFSGVTEPAKQIFRRCWRQLELFKAKWTEIPDQGDAINLDFVRKLIGASRVTTGGVFARTPNSFPFANGFRALPVSETG